MEICVLDGQTALDVEGYAPWVDTFIETLKNRNQKVQHIPLRDRKIRTCQGCWSCWVKTPGRCVIDDDMNEILPALVQADWLLMISPMLMGFPSSFLKKCMDRMVPLVHPYIEIEDGECHHRRRYMNTPKVGLILHRTGETDVEDIDITTDLFNRFARNMKTKLAFTRLIGQPVTEVCDAIDHL